MEILARFAEKNEKLEEEGYYKVESDVGDVFLPRQGVAYSNTLTFGIVKFLWMPRITVDGACASADLGDTAMHS